MPGQNNLFQVFVINSAVTRIRPPRVCDISPGNLGAVYNFVGLEPKEIEASIRNGEVWDLPTVERVQATANAKA